MSLVLRSGPPVAMAHPRPSDIMEELVADLATIPNGPSERLIYEIYGAITLGTGTGDSPQTAFIHDRANAAIQELRQSWGPTADPHWVDELVPGRESDGIEYDCLFALFHRK